ncbi:hypothetical protein, partial [Alexandriicola marinus]|uniref:hypothetical protein n=1 Tax=Alexandriicola marinus TaxID=2081710 RepID=UPI0019815C69
TLETVSRLRTFQARAFDHSATCPRRGIELRSGGMQGLQFRQSPQIELVVTGKGLQRIVSSAVVSHSDGRCREQARPGRSQECPNDQK